MKGKICVVTGSTKGIGKGIAEALAENGGTVVICSRKQNECDAVAAEIREKYGVDAIGVSADITKTEAIENLFNTVMEKYGRVDVLVNNAGLRHHQARRGSDRRGLRPCSGPGSAGCVLLLPGCW